MDGKKKLTNPAGELMRVLDITPDDLLANDNGMVTAHQRATVLNREQHQWMPWRVLAIVAAIVSITIPPILYFQPNAGLSAALTVGGISLFIAVALGLLQHGTRYSIQNDLDTNNFETIQGVAVVNISDEGSSSSYLEINGRTLQSSKDILRRIQHLKPYRIHFLPGTDTILSMELIDEDDNIRRDAATNRLRDDTGSEYDIIDDSQQSQSGIG